ncbi:hypothetical protein PR048_022611 [Dryococelus australis]|uniref:E3 ubiquitin-protein ligase n=1 Tax=Dryococelus australis TaxID=614101 RepID=A0ABQ9H1F1_9NEOP|nr:hypothetical protein PR048_022611 [Dryococelus australis]
MLVGCLPGWWQYEERTSNDIDAMFKLGEPRCEMLICGQLYVIDFESKQQYRKYEPGKRRRIKQDLKSSQKKGVAGIR